MKKSKAPSAVKEDDIVIFTSNAKSSGKVPRFDLIPRVALEKLARRFELGARKYGEFNYKQAFLDDKDFIIDRLNHLQQHVQALLSPSRANEWDDDNIGAILWAAAMLAELEATNINLLNLIREEREHAIPSESK